MLQLPYREKYDEAQCSKAFTSLALRIIVSGYVGYIAWKIVFNSLGGKSTIPLWCAILFGTVFFTCAAAFAVYAVISFAKSMKAAKKEDTLSDETSS